MSDRQSPSQKTVAIVDPVSTGVYLAAEFALHGWTSVAVHSGNSPKHYAKQVRREDFTAHVEVSDDASLEQATRILAGMGVARVVPGSEFGVDLAERLGEALELPGNVPLAGRPRRDKGAMASRAAAAGLSVPRSQLVTSRAEVSGALDRVGFPCVVKPVASAGSQGVSFCFRRDEVQAVVDRLLGTQDAFGQPIDALLLQEQLTGQQYFVNAVSSAGEHLVHEIWQDDRMEHAGHPLYDRQILLPAEGALQQEIAAFVRAVLDAVGIREGASHTELFRGPRGCVLVEVGARLEGGVTPQAPLAATGTNQVALLAESITDPASFRARIGHARPLRRHLMVVVLAAAGDAVVDAAGLAAVRALESVPEGFGTSFAAGDEVRETVDLFSSPGHVNLLADSLAQLEQDCATIRELESRASGGLYRWAKS